MTSIIFFGNSFPLIILICLGLTAKYSARRLTRALLALPFSLGKFTFALIDLKPKRSVSSLTILLAEELATTDTETMNFFNSTLFIANITLHYDTIGYLLSLTY